MGIRIDKPLRQQLIFISLLLMLVFLFTSRYVLSLSFIFFLLLTCLHKNIGRQLIFFFRNPFLVGIALLFFIPCVAWFWTDDKSMWARFARIKLPLLLFPIAFAGNWQLSSKQWRWVAYAFLILVFAGCCWSLWQYAQDFAFINRQYLKAKIFATPLENDHVRFSLVVCIAVICSVLLLQKPVFKNEKYILVASAVFFIVYLHILSARTGLFSLYIFFAVCIFYLLIYHRKSKWSVVLLVMLIATPVAAWFLVPTFQNRIRYNLYDLSTIRQNKYVQGSNDGNRVLSYKAGWHVLNENPLGVGGDIVDHTFQWYQKNVPRLPERDRLFPASEFLMYAGFAGWPGLILFTIAIFLPFFVRSLHHYFFWFALNLVMASSFLFDIGLEAQFGVFIYGFIVLWWWKWFHLPSKS